MASVIPKRPRIASKVRTTIQTCFDYGSVITCPARQIGRNASWFSLYRRTVRAVCRASLWGDVSRTAFPLHYGEMNPALLSRTVFPLSKLENFDIFRPLFRAQCSNCAALHSRSETVFLIGISQISSSRVGIRNAINFIPLHV